MRALIDKVLCVLGLLIPAAIYAYFAGLKKGRVEKAELQRKFLNETLEAELKKNAELVDIEFGNDAGDVVRKAISPDRKRDNG